MPPPRAIGVWTVGETAAHVAGSAEYFDQVLQGEAELMRLDPDGVAAHADAALADEPRRQPADLAPRLDAGTNALAERAVAVDHDPYVELFQGVVVPVSTLVAVVLAEYLVHGWDIARAARQPWRIEREPAALALDGLTSLLPFLLDRRAAHNVQLRGELRIRWGSRMIITIENSRLQVAPGSATPVDFRLSVDPATYLLMSFGRRPVWQAVLSGGLTAWGRRPWRAGKLNELLMTV